MPATFDLFLRSVRAHASIFCSMGSANIDIRSFSIDYEPNAVLYSERLARELEEDFEQDLAHCAEFDPHAYRGRNPALPAQGLGQAAVLAFAVGPRRPLSRWP